MPDRFGERHPIPFETRRENKYVGCQIEFDDALSRHGAEHIDPVAEAVGLDVGVKLRGGGRVAGAVTRDRQPPGHVGKCDQRRDQQIVSFARHHRTN